MFGALFFAFLKLHVFQNRTKRPLASIHLDFDIGSTYAKYKIYCFQSFFKIYRYPFEFPYIWEILYCDNNKTANILNYLKLRNNEYLSLSGHKLYFQYHDFKKTQARIPFSL